MIISALYCVDVWAGVRKANGDRWDWIGLKFHLLIAEE